MILTLDLDHTPADLPEAIEMLRRAKILLSERAEATQEGAATKIAEQADNLFTMAEYVNDAEAWRGAFQALRKYAGLVLRATSAQEDK